MRTRTLKHAVVWIGLIATTTVFAQNAAPPAPAGRAAPPGEMVTQAKDMMSKMQATLQRVVQLQEVARKAKDIIKLNCVNDKLVQVKGNMNVAESASTAMHESIARADEGQRSHEFTRISLTSQKVQVLGTEAENCIGEDLTFVGTTEVKVEVDPSIPEADPTREAKPEAVIERPPVASPFN